MEKRIFLVLIPLVFLGSACGRSSKLSDHAKRMTDSLFTSIEYGTADGFFSEEYFPKNQTAYMMNILKNKCDFAHRRGNFINDFFKKDPINGDVISDIYEYHLKCDDLRLIVSYKVNGESLKLFEFRLESAKKDNPMILFPQKRIIKQ